MRRQLLVALKLEKKAQARAKDQKKVCYCPLLRVTLSVQIAAQLEEANATLIDCEQAAKEVLNANYLCEIWRDDDCQSKKALEKSLQKKNQYREADESLGLQVLSVEPMQRYSGSGA